MLRGWITIARRITININDSVVTGDINAIIEGAEEEADREDQEELEQRAKLTLNTVKAGLMGQNEVEWIRENMEFPEGDPGKRLINEPVTPEEFAEGLMVLGQAGISMEEMGLEPVQEKFRELGEAMPVVSKETIRSRNMMFDRSYQKMMHRVMWFYIFVSAIGATALIASQRVGSALDWFVDIFGIRQLIMTSIMASIMMLYALQYLMRPYSITVMQ